MKKYIYSTISFVVFAIPSVLLIINLLKYPDLDGFLLNFIADYLVCIECMNVYDIDYTGVAENIILLIANLNITLLILSYIYTIILLLISDITKISIHWLIKSGILAGLIILINYFFLNSTTFADADFFSASGVMILNLSTLIYYLTMFLIILVVQNWLSKKHV